MIRKWVVLCGLWLALILALVGSLNHVAWGFSTLSAGDMTLGYVQAVAVDIGLAALALGIQQRRAKRQGTLRLWFGVVVFALVSTYANLLHGFFAAELVNLPGDAPVWLLPLRPWLLSAVLPLMVVYLSEIVSDNTGDAAEVQPVQMFRSPVHASNGSAAGTELAGVGAASPDAVQVVWRSNGSKLHGEAPEIS